MHKNDAVRYWGSWNKWNLGNCCLFVLNTAENVHKMLRLVIESALVLVWNSGTAQMLVDFVSLIKYSLNRLQNKSYLHRIIFLYSI